MATPEEELRRMVDSVRTPGMSRTPSPRGATMGGVTRGADLDNRATASLSSRTRQPGSASGVSSVPTTDPAARLAGGLTTMTSSAQSSRNTTEAGANPIIGQSLRRQMAERDRIQRRLQEPGSLNPVELRALMAQQQGAQAGVDASIAGINAMREAGVADRGQSLGAVAGLEDRQMQEAGAFDRALLGIDEAMLQGEYGLAGIRAQGQANDPYAGFTLDLMEQLASEGDIGTQMGLVNVGRGLGTVAPPGPAYQIETGPGGTTVTGSGTREDMVFQTYQNIGPGTPEGEAYLRQQGLVMGEDGSFMTLEQAAAQEEAEAAARRAQEWNDRNSPEMQQRRRPREGQPTTPARDPYADIRDRRRQALERALRLNDQAGGVGAQ